MRSTEPKHVWVRIGGSRLPGLLIEWRPCRAGGDASGWEAWVIYVDHDYRDGSTRVTQCWVHGDMLSKV